ncbi:MAG: 3-phosphoshikimate 1-carboxyvinyltransferase, partial [Verrucomicrobia bacterium]|nr:3-phosphoshikimate 1-carboxyvinyltransferase [Verrucomicrobiota bacterium]
NHLDCGNSGTLMRLMCGIMASRPFETTLVGDASLSCRPMRRVVEPLARMGANLRLAEPKGTPPIVVRGGKLRPVEYKLPVASAQVKSAILFAALRTPGQTTVVEPLETRDHTERMMSHYSIELQKRPAGAGFAISLSGEQFPAVRDFIVPGDISSAAFWLVAAAAQENSRLVVRNVGLNRTRKGVLSVLKRMGAQIKEKIWEFDEPRGEIELFGAQLHGTEIGGQEIPNIIDEIPILAVAGALAQGKTIIRDAHELRVKETDRLAAVTKNLSAMGVKVAEFDDGLEIQGGQSLMGAHIDSFGDHRIAMAFAIAGMFATGETVISGAECIATSYPGFEVQLKRLLLPNRERLNR